ncbi:acyl-CoA thioesterase [Halococcus dombrowskii]|uniref:Acyl-CoA thioesterase n=2 Tax=Halococcus dombrowskii TaxID=179637 RepID=A0AAX3AMT0_HALDO|nr:acyl-CoA thioesterase [Halococcus dombrowskii]UOO95538.1 acyl-CoA thioesterase [Halococcus dombrowskii]
MVSVAEANAAADRTIADESVDDRNAGEVTLGESYTETSEILMPTDTNNLGRALGGRVLHWMDICAAIASRRFSGGLTVTAAMEGVEFLAPIEQGEIVTLSGYVFATGRTSMDVKVTVTAERPAADELRETTTSFFMFVAVDGSHGTRPVPDLACANDHQHALRERALEQRRDRHERTG